ncbi:hypothetical protein GKQ77_11795 [Streptomyces sp. BG9H]|uniref:Ricin B lectin domain-containing protein n=2 Tax=Streptomyces anatolicus TaxID=2675858 RepID=A0ABS6YMB9_9ACTN|nr:hypothetical protein [Streptomyces anatolicus]
MAVLPVVVIATGTTLALQNLPYVTHSDSAAGAPPSTSATAPKDPSAPPDKNGPTKPGSDKTAKKKRPKDADDDNKSDDDSPQGKGKNGDAPDGDSAADGKNPSQGKGDGDSKDSDSSDDDNANENDNDNGGNDTDGDAPTNPTSGPFRLKNADNGSCLTQVYGAADDGTCGDPSARWSTVSAENNSFKVVNKDSGSCLVANMLGQAVFVGDCTQGEARLWRWGPDNTLKSTANGGCLDLAYGGGISATTCQSGKASQHWNR